MRLKPILVWVACPVLIAGCAGDSLVEPPAQSTVNSPAPLAAGQTLAVAGAGLLIQPAQLQMNVPVADPADILEASFYWMGRGPTSAGDDTILIDGVPHTGTLVASRNVGGTDPWILIYRLDGAGIVVPGSHAYVVSDFDPGSFRRGGIALAVIHRDPASLFARIRTVEPYELARWDLPGEDRGAVWSFPVTPDAADRVAALTIVAADCEAYLPDRIWWGTGAGAAPAGDLVGTGTAIADQLTSSLGPWLDVFRGPALIVPAGAEHFAYQIESPSGGDGIVHLFGAVGITGDEPGCAGRIGDRVWHDQDGDGIQDAGEPGLAGVTVSLFDAAGAPLGSTATDATGWYEFGGLCAGAYRVEPTAPPGFVPSPCGMGVDDNFDSDCSPATVTLATDSDLMPKVDFGFVEVLPPPPPPPVPGCFRGAGFWKHEIDVATGVRSGRAHLQATELAALLQAAAGATTIDFGGGGGTLTMSEAAAILSAGPGSACDKARRHALAMMLNFALNGSDPAVATDTDSDGVPETPFGDAIRQLESLLGAGDPASCRAAADLAESVNEMPDGDCFD